RRPRQAPMSQLTMVLRFSPVSLIGTAIAQANDRRRRVLDESPRWEGLDMTRQSLLLAESLWCQAGRTPVRPPNYSKRGAMGRAVLLSLLVGYLGWTLVSALKTSVNHWTRSLQTARIEASCGHDSPMRVAIG